MAIEDLIATLVGAGAIAGATLVLARPTRNLYQATNRLAAIERVRDERQRLETQIKLGLELIQIVPMDLAYSLQNGTYFTMPKPWQSANQIRDLRLIIPDDDGDDVIILRKNLDFLIGRFDEADANHEAILTDPQVKEVGDSIVTLQVALRSLVPRWRQALQRRHQASFSQVV